MNKSYHFGTDASREQILGALAGLAMEAEQEAQKNALRFLQTNEEEYARKASFYDGQRKLASSLRWAFSGTAVNDGCDPTVAIG